MAARADPSKPNRAADRPQPTDLSGTELLELFGDEYTRAVFEAVAEKPRSGREVADAADVSRATAYRRLNDLRDVGLVRSELSLSRDGHHRERFEVTDTAMSVSVGGDGIQAAVRSRPE
ncbi:winged helix-turn-helix domain-containing protein [Halapricum desulfuricans]|uniref:Transcriptional regulator containing HTH domain,ArsR family n=1 Tax=Halapricum desulfuricans TaxID=2841257 RepID=A0A897MXI8_9EURY|nr:winged helix-turn-helix domain-containing protein [Halapricum desulfuricans]QSG04991.1 Transcriptional regulator containing HTH domain,ArsR family [Halapricum desulfuricans]